jgi:hypothetical protein
MSNNPSIPTPSLPALSTSDAFQYMRNLAPTRYRWQAGAFGYSPMEPQEPAMYVHMPITISNSTVIHLSATIDAVSADLGHVVARLDRHDDMLQEILETVRVIEFETRRLAPDAINDILDTSESEMNSVLQMVREHRLPTVNPEIDALLEQAIERRRTLTSSTEQEIATR